MKKKIVSYALFGRNTRYAEYLPAIVRANLALFPPSEGWRFRLHHDDALYASRYSRFLHTLQRDGLIELRCMGRAGDTPLCKAMLWRLAPLFGSDEEPEAVFCRDLDALPTPREYECMHAFLRSSALVHTIHDSPLHDGIMGGLCGFKGELRGKLGNSLDAFLAPAEAAGVDWTKHGTDQDVLNRYLAPEFKVLEHYFSLPRSKAGLTAPLPMHGCGPWLDSWITAQAESLTPHMGAAGFDVERAEKFYIEYGMYQEKILEAQRYSSSAGSNTTATPALYYVALSSDARPDYSFFLPLTCAMWGRVLPVQPIVILTGEAQQWLGTPQLRLPLERAAETGAEIYFIGEFDGFDSSTVAQVARLCAGEVAYDPVYVLTSDMDMWPLNRWMHDRSFSGASQEGVNLFYANAYGPNGADPSYPSPVHFPMCYIGAAAHKWREIMGQSERGGHLREAVAAILAASTTRPEEVRPSDWAWNFDEIYFGRKLAAWPGFPGRCNFINRDFSKGLGRIDRSDWRAVTEIGDYADAHLLRPGYTEENWSRIRPLLAAKLDAKWLAWADAYRADYVDLPS